MLNHTVSSVMLDTDETVMISDIKLRIDSSRYSQLMLKVLREGKYEGEERTIIPRFISPKDRIIEIGTAVGLVTMVSARIVGDKHIITIDANPEILRDAEWNFRSNAMDISAVNGVMRNRNSFKPGYTASNIHRDFWASSLERSPGTVNTIDVPILCMEDEISSFGANTLICDIEGGEADLFPGSDLRGINKIMVETHPNQVGPAKVQEAIKSIQRQGFSIDFANSWGGIVCFYRGF